MSALVEYGSSSDEEEDAPEQVPLPPRPLKVHEEVQIPHASVNGSASETNTKGIRETENPQIGPNAPLVGPALGPSDSEVAYMLSPSADVEPSTPQSPYSANKSRLRQLTLPSLPNFNMPDSPPGSPPAGTNAKFARFLELKKQGVHFNEKLAKSSALKNLSMMQKLMTFADIDDAEQYATTLPKELWDPNAFPEWSYKEELGKSQQKILKKREDEKIRGQRESVDFVPATASGDSSRSGTPGASVVGRLGPKSAAERVMAGLDRGKSTSPAVQAGIKRKTRFES